MMVVMARGNTRTLRIGFLTLLISCALILLPLMLGTNPFNRFLVAFGFLGACFALSCLLNGAWDLWRERGKP